VAVTTATQIKEPHPARTGIHISGHSDLPPTTPKHGRLQIAQTLVREHLENISAERGHMTQQTPNKHLTVISSTRHKTNQYMAAWRWQQRGYVRHLAASKEREENIPTVPLPHDIDTKMLKSLST
jgi:hypothetical protein